MDAKAVSERSGHNFFRVNTDEGIQTGWGAWQATARASTLDLNSQNINGERLSDLTVGLNWYYTTRSRVMFNDIHAFLDAKGANKTVTSRNADIFAVRYQWAFELNRILERAIAMRILIATLIIGTGIAVPCAAGLFSQRCSNCGCQQLEKVCRVVPDVKKFTETTFVDLPSRQVSMLRTDGHRELCPG